MLKVAGNPLNPQLHPVTALSPSLSDMKDDNAREFIITRKLLEFMKANSATRDSGEDSTCVMLFFMQYFINVYLATMDL